MIHTKQLETRLDLYEIAPFVKEVIGAMPDRGLSHTKLFQVLESNIGRDGFAIWTQVLKGQLVAFASATINWSITGEIACWIWLTYAKPGADLQRGYEKFILPWALGQGANRIQASDCTFISGRHKAKERWYSRLGMKKTFEIYERQLT